LNFARSEITLFPKSFDNGQAEGQGLSGAGKITSDDVLIVVNRVETVRLHREEVLDTAGSQFSRCCGNNLRKAGKSIVLDCIALLLRSSLNFSGQTGFVIVIALLSWLGLVSV